jgi:anaphase-promoting complex subunit 1
MALGFLFLGGGRFCVASDNMSVAALLIACYPKLPQHSWDNRYHLQVRTLHFAPARLNIKS